MILSDNNTYSQIKKNPTKKIELFLNKSLKKQFDKKYINKFDFFKLRSSDSLLPKAHGLPKTKRTYPIELQCQFS